MEKNKYLKQINIKSHPILKDLSIDLINPKTSSPYEIIAFVGENGCGKTTLLNELFKYNKSEYIVDKEDISRPYNNLYLRQGSVHSNALKEIRKLIDGKDMYPNSSSINKEERSYDGQKSLHILDQLGDEQVKDIVRDKHLDEISCSGEVSRLINGKEIGYNITNYSSGQQEILLKLKDIQDLNNADYILLDEPETSLHPRWQKQIINLIREMIKEEHNEVPQIFLATHSEKVLESLIQNENTLIVRLLKENGTIKYETVNQMNLVLPNVTFAELDYVIFKIDTYEYCSQLYDLIEWRTEKNERAIDTLIRESGFYDPSIHYKEWFNDRFGKVSAYSIATYCRNYFHHPKDRDVPTPKQLHDAIELLRNVVLHLK